MGVVNRHGDLIRDEGQELLLVRRVCLFEAAGKSETSQFSMCGAQGEHTSRLETQFREAIENLRKTSPLIRDAGHDRPLILVDPPGCVFLFGKSLQTTRFQLVLIRLGKIPLDPIGRAVELTEDVEFNHLMQFVYYCPEQILLVRMRPDRFPKADNGFVAGSRTVL